MAPNIVDISRYRRRVLRFFRELNWQGWVVTGTAVIGLASAAVWLVRDVQSFVGDSGPASGSLIVNINTATAEELESVPGIGAARSAQIIAGRPYSSVDDLDRIFGFGEKTITSMRSFLTVEGETRKR